MTLEPRLRSCVGGGPEFPGSRAGWRILIPGYPQWRWRQLGRGLVLFGSYSSALLVAVFAWGTTGSLLLLAFAVGTHVVSVADAIRQVAFPGFGRLVPWFSATFGIGLGCYGPVLVLAGSTAWPIMLASPEEGYVVHRWFYQHERPKPGHWVWLTASPSEPGRNRFRTEPQIAQILATSGDWVKWSGEPSQGETAGAVSRSSAVDDRCRLQRFQVPDGFLLIQGKHQDAGNDHRPTLPSGPTFVPESRVRGRAWAQLYPIWNRRFLP